jgi:Uma2 family endonuclease
LRPYLILLSFCATVCLTLWRLEARLEKFTAYQSIDSFREYLLISQSRPPIIRYVRQSKGKLLRSEAQGFENEVALEFLNLTLSLREIYWRVEFEMELLLS